MAKRLQVIVQDVEYRQIQRVAKARHLSIAEWVRQALNVARRQEPEGDANRKIDAIRKAVVHDFEAADISQMLTEIERGYSAELS
jgi:hypothetical protein